ncbi:MAG: hypothetical protein IT238_07045 [Bacteroidia bacterium]|nr:hypothetical protein [Bacteroidia bacterium]MCZ2247515.1 hypothetical protein [Bacteroidia bacterium]
MIKDIPELKVENVGIAIIPELNELNEKVWNSYLINLKEEIIEGVLVTSTGYGTLNEQNVKTSTLRHFLDTVMPNSYIKIEPIVEEVFGVNNEYWLSFYSNNKMYDKRFVFLAESIVESNFTNIPLINKKGVMII